MHAFLARHFTPAPDSASALTMRLGRSPWSDAVHLLWTIWVVVTPLFTPQGHDLRWLLLTLATWPLFVLLCVLAYVRPARSMWRYGTAVVALSLALMPWYTPALTYVVFGCVLMQPSPPRLPVYLARVAAVVALLAAWALVIDYPWQALVWVPVMVPVIVMIVHFESVGERSKLALYLSQEEVRRLAATAERERIGRDLHDLLGHTLSLVALKADLAGKLLSRDPSAARREIDELGGVARQALAQVRRAVSGIRSAQFAAELAAARVLLQGEGIALQQQCDDAARLPPELETALALCLREAVTNVHRHARARQVRVALELQGDRCRLRVEDDGRGGTIRAGNGLSGMRERVQALGGSLRLEALQPRGTRLLAELPMPRQPDRGGGVDASAAAVGTG